MRPYDSASSAELQFIPQSVNATIPGLENGLSQYARLISIDTPLGADALVVERFSGSEAISALFRFEVDCIARVEETYVDSLLGEEVTLRLRLANGLSRCFHGLVTHIRFSDIGSPGRYRLTLEPWLQLLALRRDSYVFQDKTVLDIVGDVLGDYEVANYRFDVGAKLPKRSLTVQYQESDYDLLKRLLAEEGLNFYFEHECDPTVHLPEAEREKGCARHQLVIFDDNASLAACDQPVIRYHRTSSAETADTIVRFTQRSQIAASIVTLSSWDYKKVAATTGASNLPPLMGACPELEMFEGAGAYRYSDAAESARIAQARAESLALTRQGIDGESSARSLAVGTWFMLAGHPIANGEYAVLAITHESMNNLSPVNAEPGEHTSSEWGSYRNQFTAIPRNTTIRPPYLHPKPVASAPQTALVVGVRTEEISTERDHRVKVQFMWQRGDRAVAGQLPHPSTSNAPGDETAGTWVRVAEPSAGANWGANFVPRIGQEVCIDFIDGDIDRPVVIGQLYNGADTPPFHGADNHPGALSGIRTKEYAAGGFNQWLFDDTSGQLRQTLASSVSASQLHTGYLIRQNGNMRGAFRGIGFELATDGWSTLRAQRGMFLSTAQRREGASAQLDTSEARGKMQAAAEMARALSDAAAQHRARSLAAPECLHQLRKDLGAAEDQQAPAFAKPFMLVDSSAGVSAATPASAVLLSGRDMTMAASLTTRVTAEQAVTFAAATGSLFTHAGGAKAIAAKGAISVRAHTGAMDILADNTITVTSSNGSITVQAKQEILLASGGGYIRLAGSNIDIHCPASVSVNGTTHGFMGAASVSAAAVKLPDSRTKQFDE